MKIIRSRPLLDALLDAFARRYDPKLTTMQGAFGKCKFASYELAMYLRSHGVRARVVHCQGIREGNSWKSTAHKRWRARADEDWSHYVVICGVNVIDMTARQFDTELAYPLRMTIPALKSRWVTAEEDGFINRWLDQVLRSGARGANRRKEVGVV